MVVVVVISSLFPHASRAYGEEIYGLYLRLLWFLTKGILEDIEALTVNSWAVRLYMFVFSY